MVYDATVVKEEGENILRINCVGGPYGSSLEDSDALMMNVLYKLQQYREATRIQMTERRIYEYDAQNTRMLKEIVETIRYIRSSRELFAPPQQCETFSAEWLRFIHDLVTDLLLRDPCFGYVETVRRIRLEEIEAGRDTNPHSKSCRLYFAQKILGTIRQLLERCTLIQVAQPFLEGYNGEREIYRRIFKALIRPNFTFTRIMAEYPKGAEQVMGYKVQDADVTIFRMPEQVRPFYHLMPPEFRLSEEQYAILDSVRQVMIHHRPSAAELVEPERVRAGFHDIAFDLIREYAKRSGQTISAEEAEMLSSILVRETAGFGILELVLADERVQDVTVNAPAGQSPMFIFHSDVEDCQTNIIPTREEVESWAARLRLMSGRPLDQSNPVLDTSIDVPGARARVSAITRSLSPLGLGFAFRRHRDRPWTLPLFIQNGMLSPLSAGLLSFMIDGGRTILVAGTRSSGKSSLLGAMMIEIMRKNRIITIEDTLELPVAKMAEFGFNIQSLKVQSAIVQLQTELSAADGIRTSLRLGDSCLIVGEVRSNEAVALYEAMRIGALANVVAGTIHGDSPYGVYDRVVNDLKVPVTSFKATDLIVIANPIRSADGLHRIRRAVQIAEVRKEWEHDPLKEKGFVDLMTYDVNDDELKATSTLTEGESEIVNKVASRVKDWIGNFDAVWENISLRANIKQAVVDYAKNSGNQTLLEAPFVIAGNDMFHIISEQVKSEHGSLVSDVIFERWDAWAREAIRSGKF